MNKFWLIWGILLYALVACTSVQPLEAVESASEYTPSVLWEVLPGGNTDSHEYYYEGPPYQGEDCLQVSVEASQLPVELELYIQSADQRFAINLVPWLEQGVKTVEIPLMQLMLKDPTFGGLDPAQTFLGSEIDYAGLRAHDPTREFDFRVTSFVFAGCSASANL